MEIYFTNKFSRKLIEIVRTNPKLNNKVKKLTELLKVNPGHPSLRLHKIKSTDNYSISPDIHTRIIISWKKDIIYFIEIGSHDEVY